MPARNNERIGPISDKCVRHGIWHRKIKEQNVLVVVARPDIALLVLPQDVCERRRVICNEIRRIVHDDDLLYGGRSVPHRVSRRITRSQNGDVRPRIANVQRKEGAGTVASLGCHALAVRIPARRECKHKKDGKGPSHYLLAFLQIAMLNSGRYLPATLPDSRSPIRRAPAAT